MVIEPAPEYEFAVYFYKKASVIKVYDKDGQEVEGEPLSSKSTLDKINQLDTLQVAHKAGHSPCCVVWNGEKYCWC